MLTYLAINNYATVETLELQFKNGMTVITGETGAGKSVILDTLSLVAGGRSDSKAVRHGAKRTDIHATYDISGNSEVQGWLRTRDLQDGDELFIRRIITREGRSRAYINGQPAPVQDLRQIGELLIDIHSQHEHQSLLKTDRQRDLLDAFAGCIDLQRDVRQVFTEWQDAKKLLQGLRDDSQEHHAQLQLLQYQVQELDELAVQENELVELEKEFTRLNNGEAVLADSSRALAMCQHEDNGNLLDGCQQLEQLIAPHGQHEKELKDTVEMVQAARIQLQEATYALQAYVDGFEIDPERLRFVEQRLSTIYDVARKHRIQAPELHKLHTGLLEQLQQLGRSDERMDELAAEVELLEQRFNKQANALSKQRTPAARSLTTKVNRKLKTLNMAGCVFEVRLTPKRSGVMSSGNENVEFLISTIPGHPPQALNRIASGGELSRISLAIQVVTASKATTPVLVFDEVDVGISGGVAEVVGALLCDLGKHCQILCVTHLPQVASQGNQHIAVRKFSSRKKVSTELNILEDDAKVEEIARMLGGVAITEQSRAHAMEMLGAH